jgi:hypothetical protein
MATKAGILATINGFITSVITQAKHRSSMSTVVDEIYPNNVTDTHLTETYTTKSGTNITYSISIVKSGNIAHVKGTITNVTGLFLTPQNIFLWKSNEFRPKSAVNELLFTARNSTDSVRLFLSNNVLAVNTVMGLGTFNFEFITYITQD